MTHIDIVFDGPPGHESGRFVEVENPEGRSINAAEWLQRPDGYWVLRIQQAAAVAGEESHPITMAMDWTPKERAAIDECMQLQDLSERAVIRQALAHYQIICRKAHGLYVDLGSKQEGASEALPDRAPARDTPNPGDETRRIARDMVDGVSEFNEQDSRIVAKAYLALLSPSGG